MFKMAANSKAFSFRHEGHMFFIYDHKKKTEEDDPKDAILYFYPRLVSVDEQVALVGGIIGLADFCLDFMPQCIPSIVKLSGFNFALLQHENFIIGLADSPDVPDKFLISHMNFVWSTFMLYQGSLEAIRERVSEANFLKELNRVWDMYLPLCQIQGDLLSQAYQVLPYVQLHKSQGNLYLHASHILQRCLRCKGVIAGALFNRNKVLCTQLSNNLTRQLLLLMSHSQFPLVEANSLLELPGGVRLLYIFLPQDEYVSLGHRRKKSYVPGTRLSQGLPTKSTDLQGQKETVLRHSNKDRDRHMSDPMTPPFSRAKIPVSPTATVASGTDSEIFMDTLSELNFDSLHQAGQVIEENDGWKKPASQSNPSEKPEVYTENVKASEALAIDKVKINIQTENDAQARNIPGNGFPEHQSKVIAMNTKLNVADSSVDPTYSQLAQSVHGADLTITKSVHENLEDVGTHAVGKAEENMSSDLPGHKINSTIPFDVVSTGNVVCAQGDLDKIDGDIVLSDLRENSDEKKENSICLYSSTSVKQDVEFKLLSNVKDATIVTDKLFEIGEPSASEFLPPLIPGKETTKAHGVHLDDINVKTMLDKSQQDIDASLEVQISSEETQWSPRFRPENNDGSQLSLAYVDSISASRDRLTFELGDSENSEGDITSPVSDLSRLSPVLELTGDDSLLLSSTDYEVQMRVKKTLHQSPSRDSDSRNSSQFSQQTGVKEVLVYAQGHSDTLLVLLLSRSAKCGKSYINSLWKSCLSHLAELDFEVKDAERHMKDEAENIGAQFQFIKYDSFTQSLKGSALLPVTSLANEIVDSSVRMHRSFLEMPELQDITYRSHSASCFGHRSVNSETYFQLGLSPTAAGICSPQDKTFSLEQIAEKVLQKEAKLSML